MRVRFSSWFILCAVVLAAAPGFSGEVELTTVPFDAEHWQLGRARALEVDGRSAIAGTAFAT